MNQTSRAPTARLDSLPDSHYEGTKIVTWYDVPRAAEPSRRMLTSYVIVPWSIQFKFLQIRPSLFTNQPSKTTSRNLCTVMSRRLRMSNYLLAICDRIFHLYSQIFCIK